MFIGLSVAGAVFMMSEDEIIKVVRPLPVIGHSAEKIADFKADFSTSASYAADDAIYAIKSTWRSITDISFSSRPQRVIIELEPVRTKRPKLITPPPTMPQSSPEPTSPRPLPQNNDSHNSQNSTDAPPEAAPQMEAMAHTMTAGEPEANVAGARSSDALAAIPQAPSVADQEPAQEVPATDVAVSPAQPSEPTAAADDTAENTQNMAPEAPKQTAAEPVITETAMLRPPKKPPPPAPKIGSGIEEHKQGLAYYKGIGGVAKNFNTAAKWFRQSSAKGNAAAQYNLGIMSYLGQGMEQSYEQAADWFRQAAAQDHALAQYNLGFLYYEGKGVEKDDLQAFMWIDRAARLGDEKAVKARETLEKVLPKEILKTR